MWQPHMFVQRGGIVSSERERVGDYPVVQAWEIGPGRGWQGNYDEELEEQDPT